MPNINITLPNPIPDLPTVLKGDSTKPIATTLAGGGTPLGVDVTLAGLKPIDANLAVVKPIEANVKAAVDLGGGTKPIVASVGGSGTPIEIGLVNLDLKPITVNLGKVRVRQENVFTFKLFGFIPLFSVRTGGNIDIEPL